MIITQYALETWQDAHGVHGLCASFFMGITKHPIVIGHAVQPVPLAADMDAGFIDMRQSSGGQFLFDPIFELGQKLKGLFIEIEKRALTDWYVQLVGEMILHPVVRDKLKL